MNISEKIKATFEAATGLPMVYGTEEEINRAIGYDSLPCGIFTLISTSAVTTDGGTISEMPTISVAVITTADRDPNAYDNETKIDACKNHLYKWVKALYRNDLLRFVEVGDATRIYDEFDDVVTGYCLQLKIEELDVFGCADPVRPLFQEKTVDPGDETIVVLPDAGYLALSKVTVTAGGGALPWETINVTPTTEAQTIEHTDGYAIEEVNVSAVTSSIDANIQPENIRKDTTILGVTGTMEAPVYNASREWSAAHPTYDNAEDILANYTAGICYIFLGAVKITIPTNGTHYWTKDGEVTAGSEVQLTCAEGKDTCWLMEVYESGASATTSYIGQYYQMIGIGYKSVASTPTNALSVETYPGAYAYLCWSIGGAIVKPGDCTLSEMLYSDSDSVLFATRITNYLAGSLDVRYGSTDVPQQYGIGGFANLFRIHGVTRLGYRFFLNNNTRIVELPDLTQVANYQTLTTRTYRVRRLMVGALTIVPSTLLGGSWNELVDFEVGYGTDVDMPNTGWICSYVTSDRNASLLLISNTRRHILDKVADHTGEGLVRTITCGWVGTLSESEDEEIATALDDLMTDFADKGWTLQG